MERNDFFAESGTIFQYQKQMKKWNFTSSLISMLYWVMLTYIYNRYFIGSHLKIDILLWLGGNALFKSKAKIGLRFDVKKIDGTKRRENVDEKRKKFSKPIIKTRFQFDLMIKIIAQIYRILYSKQYSVPVWNIGLKCLLLLLHNRWKQKKLFRFNLSL